MRITPQALNQLEAKGTFPTLPTWFTWCKVLDFNPRPTPLPEAITPTDRHQITE